MWKRSFHLMFRNFAVLSIIFVALFVPIVGKSDDDKVVVIVRIFSIRALSVDGKPYFKVEVTADGEDISIGYRSRERGFEITPVWPVAYMRDIPFDRDQPINIKIRLFFRYSPLGIWRECDISKDGKGVDISYDVKRGEWTGEDYLNDGNGYGHTSGFEDGNCEENDCEIWFDIYQLREGSSFLNPDRLTLWELINVYNLDPSQNYAIIDNDGDGVPTSWEDKYGYNPLSYDDHKSLDPDRDGLDNVEEWTTSKWLSDPFSRDIFIEIDFMEIGNLGITCSFPEKSKYLLWKAFAKHNITIHIDDGCMGGGGEPIPFEKKLTVSLLRTIRERYFLHGDPNNWRKGVFHYAVISCFGVKEFGRRVSGMAFYIDSFFIAQLRVTMRLPIFRLEGSNYYISLASVFMHELGHNLGIYHSNTPGCDNRNAQFPWQKDFWKYRNYKSCMNYQYVYRLVDYSDGSHGENDFDDWGRIDLTLINYA